MTYHSTMSRRRGRLMYPLGDEGTVINVPSESTPSSTWTPPDLFTVGGSSGWTPSTTQPTNNGGSGSPGLLASFAQGAGALFGAAQAGAKATGAAQAYQTALYQQSQTPAWLLPVAIGGVAIVAVMMLTGPRRGPTSNPGRRRRRRRR